MKPAAKIEFQISASSLAKLQAMPEVLEQELRLRLERCVLHTEGQVKRTIREKGIYNTGALFNSIGTRVTRIGKQMVGYVGSTLLYAKFVEKGTVPHFVPFSIAPGLYLQARRAWGWKVPKGQKLYQAGAGGHMYLTPPGGGKPRAGVRVTGEKQPFLGPGWRASVPFIKQELLAGCKAAVQKVREVA